MGTSVGTIDYRDFDREIWDNELNDFVPALIFDMHTHLWSEAHKGTADEANKRLRWEIDYQDQLAWAAKLYPGREIHYLVLGTPVVGMDAEGHNDWVAPSDADGPAIRSEHDGNAGDDAGLRCRPS